MRMDRAHLGTKCSIYPSAVNERYPGSFLTMIDHYRLNQYREVRLLVQVNRLLFVLVEQEAWHLMHPKKTLLYNRKAIVREIKTYSEVVLVGVKLDLVFFVSIQTLYYDDCDVQL